MIFIDLFFTFRGKHNGSHDGEKYFETNFETSGSFVRESKISKGLTFEESVEDRYGTGQKISEENLEEIRREINAPFLQLVGFEKVEKTQSNFSQLKTISVRGLGVYKSGNDLGDFQVQNLDLAENLLDSWQVLAELCHQLKKLRNLNVSENRLKIGAKSKKIEEAFKNLNTLFMGRMNYDWKGKFIHWSNMSQNYLENQSIFSQKIVNVYLTIKL